MNALAVATPFAPVVTVGELVNVPLGPVAGGAVNVTLAPEIGLLKASRTNAANGVANAVLTVALCGVPENVVILAGGPAVLARVKLTGCKTPPATVAVTTYEPAIVFAFKDTLA